MVFNVKEIAAFVVLLVGCILLVMFVVSHGSVLKTNTQNANVTFHVESNNQRDNVSLHASSTSNIENINMTLVSFNDYGLNDNGVFDTIGDNWNWCDGNYTSNDGGVEYTQVPVNTLEQKPRKIRHDKSTNKLICYNDYGFSETRSISTGKTIDANSVRWVLTNPVNLPLPPPKMILTGFGYAECDGIYIHDPDRRLYKHENGTRIVLINRLNVLTCFPSDRIGFFGSRQIQTTSQNIQGIVSNYIIGKTVNWTNADPTVSAFYSTLSTNRYAIADTQTHKRFYSYQPNFKLSTFANGKIVGYQLPSVNNVKKAYLYDECNYAGNFVAISCGVYGNSNIAFADIFTNLGAEFIVKSLKVPESMAIVLFSKSKGYTQTCRMFFADEPCINYSIYGNDLRIYAIEKNANNNYSQNFYFRLPANANPAGSGYIETPLNKNISTNTNSNIFSFSQYSYDASKTDAVVLRLVKINDKYSTIIAMNPSGSLGSTFVDSGTTYTATHYMIVYNGNDSLL